MCRIDVCRIDEWMLTIQLYLSNLEYTSLKATRTRHHGNSRISLWRAGALPGWGSSQRRSHPGGRSIESPSIRRIPPAATDCMIAYLVKTLLLFGKHGVANLEIRNLQKLLKD